MELSELRIGSNYIHKNGRVFKMDMKLMYAFCSGQFDYLIEDIGSIEVTNELALKLGFQDDRLLFDYKDGQYPNANCEARFFNGQIFVYVGSDDYKIFCSPYLHDFQNIYKLITGEELKIQ